jgi:sulfopropanediol 3-dehydrogenase
MEYLKKAEPIGEQVTQDIRESVSEILMAVEREGTTAVRRYSEQLDDWNPEPFVELGTGTQDFAFDRRQGMG